MPHTATHGRALQTHSRHGTNFHSIASALLENNRSRFQIVSLNIHPYTFSKTHVKTILAYACGMCVCGVCVHMCMNSHVGRYTRSVRHEHGSPRPMADVFNNSTSYAEVGSLTKRGALAVTGVCLLGTGLQQTITNVCFLCGFQGSKPQTQKAFLTEPTSLH